MNFDLLWYFFSLHQMTPLHMAVERNRIKMVECFLDQQADINIQDDNEVILHTNAVDYFQVTGRCCTHRSFTLLFENRYSSSKTRFWLVVRMTATLNPLSETVTYILTYTVLALALT